jgi:hypothetical protein
MRMLNKIIALEIESLAIKMLDLVIIVATAILGLLVGLFWLGWDSGNQVKWVYMLYNSPMLRPVPPVQ